LVPATSDVDGRCLARKRTNIEIDETYLGIAMDRYGLHTTTEAVALALRHLAGQPMSREEAMAMRGAHAIDEPPTDTPPQEADINPASR
jgi:Arc/MetJ family transcription regulator